MKLDALIEALLRIRAERGNVDVHLQSDPKAPPGELIGYELFFVVPEEHEGGVWEVSIRPWPY